VAELGYLEDGKFTAFATTTAWNFQQGAMLQYHPNLQDTVYYNVCENGKFSMVTHNYVTGEKKYTDRPTACVSPNGKWGLAVNFGRIFAFRPGYGYAAFVDEFENVNAPEQDGIFLTDMETGVSKQLVDYPTLAKVAGFAPDQKVLINHITFNTTSDHYIALVRNFWDGVSKAKWMTSLVYGDLQGNVKGILQNTYFSHYVWINDHELLAHCTVEPGRKSLYCINMHDGSWVEHDMPYYRDGGHPDIHCNISPDGTYIIGDGYPRDGYRWIMYYELTTGKSKTLLKAKTVKPPIDDIRCDLHNRFVFDGKYISYDTTQNGCRQIALVPVPKKI